MDKISQTILSKTIDCYKKRIAGCCANSIEYSDHIQNCFFFHIFYKLASFLVGDVIIELYDCVKNCLIWDESHHFFLKMYKTFLDKNLFLTFCSLTLIFF